MALPNDRNSREYLSFVLDGNGNVALNVRPISGGAGVLPASLNDRWYQAFTTDGSGNPAINVVTAAGIGTVSSVTGTANQIVSAPTTGDVILTIPAIFIAPGTLQAVTSAQAPLVFGGTAAGSSLTLKSTSGAGTTDSILMKVGNNGAVTALTLGTTGAATFGASVTVTTRTGTPATFACFDSGGKLVESAVACA